MHFEAFAIDFHFRSWCAKLWLLQNIDVVQIVNTNQLWTLHCNIDAVIIADQRQLWLINTDTFSNLCCPLGKQGDLVHPRTEAILEPYNFNLLGSGTCLHCLHFDGLSYWRGWFSSSNWRQLRNRTLIHLSFPDIHFSRLNSRHFILPQLSDIHLFVPPDALKTVSYILFQVSGWEWVF